jgi:hypothetical protein
MSRVRWSKGTSCAAIADLKSLRVRRRCFTCAKCCTAPAFAVFPPPDENSSPIPLSRNSFDRKNHEPAGIPDLLKGHSVGVIIHSRIAQNRVLARIFHRLGAKRFYPGQEPSSGTTPQPPLNAGALCSKTTAELLVSARRPANSGRSRRLDRICLAGRNPTRACARTAKRLWLPSVYVAGHESQEHARKVPDDAPTGFLRPRWKPYVLTETTITRIFQASPSRNAKSSVCAPRHQILPVPLAGAPPGGISVPISGPGA